MLAEDLSGVLSALADDPSQKEGIKEMIHSSFAGLSAEEAAAAAAAASVVAPGGGVPSLVQNWTKEQLKKAIGQIVVVKPRHHALPDAEELGGGIGATGAGAGSAAATADLAVINCPEHLVVWTDGSWAGINPPNYAGVGVVLRGEHQQQQQQQPGQQSDWVEYGYTILPPIPRVTERLPGWENNHGGVQRTEGFDFELLGIGLGLERAAEQVKAVSATTTGPIKRVTVLCDSKDSIWAAKAHLRNFFLGVGDGSGGGGSSLSPQTFSTGCESTRVLWDHGVHVELRWCPGHAGIEGNERANTVARLAARYGCLSDFSQMPRADDDFGPSTASAGFVSPSAVVSSGPAPGPGAHIPGECANVDPGKGEGKGKAAVASSNSASSNSAESLPTPPASDGEEAAAVSSAPAGKRKRKRGKSKKNKSPDDMGTGVSLASLLASLRASGELEANRRIQQQQAQMGIMRLPLPVLRAIDEVMTTAAGMQSAEVMDDVVRKVVRLLRRTGRAEGWVVKDHGV